MTTGHAPAQDAAATARFLSDGVDRLVGWIDDPECDAVLRCARDDGGWDECPFPELAVRARRIGDRVAELFHTSGYGPDTPVAVLAATSVETVSAYCGVLDSGAALVPLSPPGMGELERTVERIGAICAAAGAPFLLTDDDHLEVARAAVDDSGVAVHAISALENRQVTDTGPDRALRDRGELALVQFTSGSTGDPRGVPIGWEALSDNCRMIAAHVGWQPGDRFGSWVPMYHDMGLVGILMTSLCTRSSFELMRPDQFIRSPQRYLEMLSRVQHSATPSFGLGYLAHRMRRDGTDVSTLDLSGCRSVVIGSEPLSAGDIAGFAEVATPLGFPLTGIRPAYGLAESTVLACAAWPGDQLRAVAIGARPALGQPVEISETWCGDLSTTLPSSGETAWSFALGSPDADLELTVCAADGAPVPEGVLGELAVRGPSVADGYHRAPGAAAPDGDAPRTRFTDGRLLTGDAAFFHQGRLHVLGRIGTSVKLRGRTVFMEDIDAAVVQAAGIPGGRVAATAVPSGPTPRILVALEAPSSEQVEAAEAAARRQAGTGPEVRIVEVPRGTIPRTSSGKPRRAALLPLVDDHLAADSARPDSSTTPDIPDRPAAPESTCALFEEVADEVSVPEGAAVLHEGSLAEGFGNPGSDVDFLVVVPGDAETPTMPTVLFAAGRRIEVRTRSVGQIRAQWQRLAEAAPESGSPEPDSPSEDLLNRCQRLAAAQVVRHGAVLEELGDPSPVALGPVLQRWWRARARACRARATAAAACGARSLAAAWTRAAGLQYLKSWLAAHDETYLESKWTAEQLRRAAAVGAPVPVTELPEDDGDWELLCDALDPRPAPSPAQLRHVRVAGVTTWSIGGRIHVIRGDRDVLATSEDAGRAWRTVVPGRDLASQLDADPDLGALLDSALELGLLALEERDPAGTWRPVHPAMAMVSPSGPPTPPVVGGDPLLTLSGATTNGERPFARCPLPAADFAACGMALVWSLMVAENAREDLGGALEAGQWGTASAAARRLVLLCARLVLTCSGIHPLPADVAPCHALRQWCPPSPELESLATTIDELLGSPTSPASCAADPDALTARLDALCRQVRTRAAGADFPSSFAGQAEWTRTLLIAYDWLRLGGHFDASLPLDEARDLVESGGMQPHTRTGNHPETDQEGPR